MNFFFQYPWFFLFICSLFRKRFNYSAHARGLATNEWDEEEDDDEYYDEENETDDMDYEEAPKKPPRSYKDQVRYSLKYHLH